VRTPSSFISVAARRVFQAARLYRAYRCRRNKINRTRSLHMSVFFAQIAMRVLSGVITALIIGMLFKCFKSQASAAVAIC